MTGAGPGRAAYGLLVLGLDGVDLLPPVEGDRADLLPLTVRQETDPPPPEGPGRSVLTLVDGRALVLDRPAATAVFHGPRLPDDVLVHPYLAAAARPWNRWAGRDTFHAGAFVHVGRAWIVCGPREAGKSSLMAALAADGVPVLADDMAVVQDGRVFRGPRSVDLRDRVPGVPHDLHSSRSGTRQRLRLDAAPPHAPLGGWFFLHWGADLTATPVPATRLLSRLVRSRSRPHEPSDPLAVLRLAGTPGWDLQRPRDWSRLGATVRTVLRTAAAAVPGRADPSTATPLPAPPRIPARTP